MLKDRGLKILLIYLDGITKLDASTSHIFEQQINMKNRKNKGKDIEAFETSFNNS